MAKYILVHGIRVCNEFTQETFGRLTSVGPKFRMGKKTYQVCQCSCGYVGVYPAMCLRNTSTRSCGCLNLEKIIERSRLHGKSTTIEYSSYKNMIERTHNANARHYADYGGRGITVCDRWREPNGQGFINFLADMGERPSKDHSIDRIDNNGNYEPGNCRWATRKEQMRNRRGNVNLTHNGKTQCATTWAEEIGMCLNTLLSRIKKGGAMEDCFTRKLHSRRKKE